MKRNEIYEVEIHYRRPLTLSIGKIKESVDAFTALQSIIEKERIDLKEFFWVILLSRANRVLGISTIGMGSTKGVVVNTKEIFQLAIKTNTSSIVLAHYAK